MPKLSALFLFFVVAAMFISEHFLPVPPCPLCYLQRFWYLVLAALYLAYAFKPWRYGLHVLGLGTLIGFGISAWHIYLMAEPSFSCGASFEILAEKFGLLYALKAVLSVDCGIHNATILGVPIPYLAPLGYLAAFILAVKKSGPPRPRP